MAKHINFSLQTRDREILDYLRAQGFASFQQLERRFFTGRKPCSRRLLKLTEAEYVVQLPIESVFPTGARGKINRRYFPYLMGVGLRAGMVVYRLSDIYLRQVGQTIKLIKPSLVLHQLLLNDVRLLLEKEISATFVLNDPKLTVLSEIDFNRRKEFTPDLSFECADYHFAIELERTLKSRSRYLMRFTHYDDSAYTHVLYIYVNERHLKSLRESAGTSRKIAFAHYLKPTELLSNTWGYLTPQEFIERVNHIRRRS